MITKRAVYVTIEPWIIKNLHKVVVFLTFRPCFQVKLLNALWSSSTNISNVFNAHLPPKDRLEILYKIWMLHSNPLELVYLACEFLPHLSLRLAAILLARRVPLICTHSVHSSPADKIELCYFSSFNWLFSHLDERTTRCFCNHNITWAFAQQMCPDWH